MPETEGGGGEGLTRGRSVRGRPLRTDAVGIDAIDAAAGGIVALGAGEAPSETVGAGASRRVSVATSDADAEGNGARMLPA